MPQKLIHTPNGHLNKKIFFCVFPSFFAIIENLCPLRGVNFAYLDSQRNSGLESLDSRSIQRGIIDRNFLNTYCQVASGLLGFDRDFGDRGRV